MQKDRKDTGKRRDEEKEGAGAMGVEEMKSQHSCKSADRSGREKTEEDDMCPDMNENGSWSC